MTLPPTTILPLHTKSIQTGDPGDLEAYIRELIFKLTTDYEAIADAINGYIQLSNTTDPTILWTPRVLGTTSGGTATYSVQNGWAIRIGFLVDIFFELEWTAHTGTGNLYVEFPYTVIDTIGATGSAPFVGSVITSNITFGVGHTAAAIQAVSNTLRGEIITYGSASASANLVVPASGAIKGSIRYIGAANAG